MPYVPTGRPNGRPRKTFEPPSQRGFVSGVAPVIAAAPVDTNPPMMGQRVRVKTRRPSLLPTPAKA